MEKLRAKTYSPFWKNANKFVFPLSMYYLWQLFFADVNMQQIKAVQKRVINKILNQVYSSYK